MVRVHPSPPQKPMILITIGLILFVLSFWMRSRYKQKEHEAGIDGMNAILIAAAILILFYGIISQMMIQ